MLNETLWKKKKSFGEFEITAYNALYFEDKRKYVVIGDLHLGMEDALRKRGIFLPKKQLSIMKTNLKKIKDLYGENITIILNGDIKHEFSELSYENKKEIENFIKFLIEHFINIIVIKGNHDTFVKQLFSKYGIEIVEEFVTERFYVAHGDKQIDYKKINKNIIISHEHPAITLRDDVNAKIKIDCYLIKRTQNKYIIVIPAFSSYSAGTDFINIDDEFIFSNILKEEGIEDFEVYGINIDDEEIMYFGTIKQLRSMF